jgi:hypothetical protein
MFSTDHLPWIMTCLAVATVAAVLIRRFYRRAGRVGRGDGHLVRASEGELGTLRSQQDLEARAMACEVRLHETARELCGRLDSKIRVLEHLTGIAERQILELRTLTDRNGFGEPSQESPQSQQSNDLRDSRDFRNSRNSREP